MTPIDMKLNNTNIKLNNTDIKLNQHHLAEAQIYGTYFHNTLTHVQPEEIVFT